MIIGTRSQFCRRQYLAWINVSCSRTQRSDAGEARSRNPSISTTPCTSPCTKTRTRASECLCSQVPGWRIKIFPLKLLTGSKRAECVMIRSDVDGISRLSGDVDGIRKFRVRLPLELLVLSDKWVKSKKKIQLGKI